MCDSHLMFFYLDFFSLKRLTDNDAAKIYCMNILNYYRKQNWWKILSTVKWSDLTLIFIYGRLYFLFLLWSIKFVNQWFKKASHWIRLHHKAQETPITKKSISYNWLPTGQIVVLQKDSPAWEKIRYFPENPTMKTQTFNPSNC